MKTWADYLGPGYLAWEGGAAPIQNDDDWADEVLAGDHDDDLKRRITDARRACSSLGRQIDRLVRRVERMQR